MIFSLDKTEIKFYFGSQNYTLMKDTTKNIALPYNTLTGNSGVMSLSINLPSNIILLGIIIISLLVLVILG